MSGLTEEEVMETRNKAIAHLKSVYGDNIEVIENYYHENAPADASRIWHLGESIKMLEKADMVYFCDDSKDSNGCIIERTICELYNIPIYDATLHSNHVLENTNTHGMVIERMDGKTLNNSERLILSELFMQQYSPSPYSKKCFTSSKDDNKLVLHAGFKHNNDKDTTVITDLECDDVVFTLDVSDINFKGTENEIWRQISNEYYNTWGKELVDSVYQSIGDSWRELCSIPWYNGLSSRILSWKRLNDNHDDPHHSVLCSDNYGCTDENDPDISALQVFWMIAVEKFGDYGTSPRYGWILSENWDRFCEWCDALCSDDIRESLECIYSEKQSPHKKI